MTVVSWAGSIVGSWRTRPGSSAPTAGPASLQEKPPACLAPVSHLLGRPPWPSPKPGS